MFEIKEARRDDLSIILTLIKELAAYEKMSDQVTANLEDLNKAIFIQKIVKVLIILEGNVVIGFCLYFNNFSTFLAKTGIYIEDIYIREKYRNKGYGKQVFQYLVKEAKTLGHERIEWSCLNWNEPSIKFYQSLGAIAMDDWKVYRLDKQSILKLSENNNENR